jgi:hypothetical protein
MIDKDIRVIFVGQRQWVEKTRLDALAAALHDLLKHCDSKPGSETEFELAVIKARTLLPQSDATGEAK